MSNIFSLIINSTSLLLTALLIQTASIPIIYAASKSEPPIYSDKNISNSCPKVKTESSKLAKWIFSAYKSKNILSCSSPIIDSAISSLEKFSYSENLECRSEAICALIAFYSVAVNHPNYSVCEFQEKLEALIIRAAVDGKVCANTKNAELASCFLDIAELITKFKVRGQYKLAFELAKKTADSSDITGLSQMCLASLYQFGNGTYKNLFKAIKWYKEALIRIKDDQDSYIFILLGLGTSYEELGQTNEAHSFYKQCAEIGELACKNAVIRLTNKQ